MAQNAPGKFYREGISLIEIMDLFPDDSTAEAWFAELRWPDGNVCCPHCGSLNVQTGAAHKMPYRCREKECGRRRFSVRTGTVMDSSNLGFRTWALAIFLLLTSLKSVSSMKLHRDLKITQKSAWHLAHRLRLALAEEGGLFSGPVEVDESYVGGQRHNMSKFKRRELSGAGRGSVGKTAVVGAKDRATNKVVAKVVEKTDRETLQGFIADHTEPGATVYSDEASAYKGIPFNHETVKHSLAEYVRGVVHINGIESLWAMLKRAHKGTFHKLSPKHLNRYVQEFAAKHNLREQDTIDIMGAVATGMRSKRLRYTDLIADNGLDSGARSV
ncbi:MAG: IS1595 family transposase [Gemmatimonadetes bacterium]|nr:IS1595 family transposase [Gemmatimonadota bacterium]